MYLKMGTEQGLSEAKGRMEVEGMGWMMNWPEY